MWFFFFRDGRKPQAPLKRLFDGPKPQFTSKKPIGDARLKILRNQVRRQAGGEAQVIGDARYRLEAMRSRNRPIRRPPNPSEPLRRTIHGRVGNPLIGRGVPMDVDMFDADPLFRPDILQKTGPLVRTVENELPLYSRRPSRPFDWDRPVEEEEEYLGMVVDR